MAQLDHELTLISKGLFSIEECDVIHLGAGSILEKSVVY